MKLALPGRTRSASRPDPPCQKRSARAPSDSPLGRHPKPSAGEAIPGKCPKRGFLSRPRTRSARSSSGPAVPDYYAAGVVVEGHLASSTWGVVDEVPPCPCRRQAIFAARRLRGGGYLLVGRILHPGSGGPRVACCSSAATRATASLSSPLSTSSLLLRVRW